MRIRRSWLVLGILLVPILARADDHRADLYAAFSGGGGGSKLFGFHEGFAKASGDWKYLSVVLSDVSVNFGSHDGNDVTQVAFMGGPRLTFGKPGHHPHKLFGHVLAGGVYTNDGIDSGTDGAVAFGGGYEILPGHEKSSKPWGARVQVDYIVCGGDRDNFWRVSGGVVYRFLRPDSTK